MSTIIFSSRGESGREVAMDVEAITAMATSLRCSDTLLVADHVLMLAAMRVPSRHRHVVAMLLSFVFSLF